jgi:hypothetical protein
VDKFNNYYISVADSIINNNFINNTTDHLNKINPLNYLHFAFKQSFTNIMLKNILLMGAWMFVVLLRCWAAG